MQPDGTVHEVEASSPYAAFCNATVHRFRRAMTAEVQPRGSWEEPPRYGGASSDTVTQGV